MGQVVYYKVGQSRAIVITKWGSYYKVGQIYYKVGQLLQGRAIIAK